MDVTDNDKLRATFEAITVQFGSIDCLVTAAGIGLGGPLVAYEKSAIERIISINVGLPPHPQLIPVSDLSPSVIVYRLPGRS